MNEQKYLEQQNESMGENSFMKKLLKKRLNQKGLTLIELLAVIVILAIVAAIAVPAIGNIIENSRYNAVKADAVNVLSAANIYFTENSDKEWVTASMLNAEGFLQDAGQMPIADTPNAGTTKPTTFTADTVVTKAASGNTLSATSVVYSGSKTVTFTNATAAGINGDDQSGSATGNKTIDQ